MRILILAAALLLGACGQQPVYRTVTTPLPVAQIELEPYLGLWYEQARLPNDFEEGCVRATAQYSMREDGLASVVNTCFEADGTSRDAKGRARLAGETGEGKLEVSFFGPFWANYWVVERADNYAWSIVSEPGGQYLWILTRAQTITPQERAVFEARVRALGYLPSDLVWASPPAPAPRSG